LLRQNSAVSCLISIFNFLITQLESSIKALSDKISKNTIPGRVDTIYVVIRK